MKGKRIKDTRGDNEEANLRLSSTSKEALCICHGKFHLHPFPNCARSNTEEITVPVSTFLKQAFAFFIPIPKSERKADFTE